MIKYIGSKRTLIPELLRVVGAFPELRSALDLFSGTSRVGHALKGAGLRVLANDHNTYAHTLATCYVQADREDVLEDAQRLIAELNALPGRAGYFTETFCVRSRFFQPKNGARVDAIREAIARKELEPTLEKVLLTSLMEAADRVDSTCGLQMAYVKKWARRSHNDLVMKMPAVLPAVAEGPCEAHQLDANEAARQLRADIAYIDPPYNQHSYLSNYHIWETLVLWDHPEAYGVACKRMDCKSRKSDYNSKRRHHEAFAQLIEDIQAPVLIVSFNDEGYQSRQQLEALLSQRGEVFVLSHDFKRYVGAQIGIHNPSGERVGAVSHLRNREYLYLVATEAAAHLPEMKRRLQRLTEEHPTAQAQPSKKAKRGDPKARNETSADKSPQRETARVPLVRRALSGQEAMSRAEVIRRTGLSGYQVNQALSELCGRGEAMAVKQRSRRRYRLLDREDDGS